MSETLTGVARKNAMSSIITHRVMMEIGNMIVKELFLADFPNHWTLKDALGEPDWEDWRDFLALNKQTKRTD